MNHHGDLAETQLLQTTAREVFTELFPSERVRELMATAPGFDRGDWHRLTGELGVTGLMVGEEFGGAGLSARELGVVFEEAGRSLGGAPMFGVAGLTIPLLLESGDVDAQARWLPGLSDGSVLATVIYTDAVGRWDPGLVDISAEGNRLDGRAGYVVEAADADLLFAPARTPNGPALFAVERSSPGVTITPLVTLDQTRKQAHVEFSGAPAVQLHATGRCLDRAFAISCALLACELVGVASRCLDMSVDYARERVQFGRAIGSFQAIKQKLADLLIQVESARSAATAAAEAAASGSADLWWTASLAKAYCSEAAMRTGEENIQIHGGIGFTWEHDAHLCFKRARTGQELLGTPREHYHRVAEHLSHIGAAPLS
jgi:alkylation response protein AidB-like acyl-CoA dehydrogenase